MSRDFNSEQSKMEHGRVSLQEKQTKGAACLHSKKRTLRRLRAGVSGSHAQAQDDRTQERLLALAPVRAS